MGIKYCYNASNLYYSFCNIFVIEIFVTDRNRLGGIRGRPFISGFVKPYAQIAMNQLNQLTNNAFLSSLDYGNFRGNHQP